MALFKKNILVIDDETQIVEILSKFLTLKGFRVQKAFRAEQGLEILKNGKIDLVVLDEKMPGIGGSGFCEHMRKMKMDVPVIVLTGSVSVSSLAPEVRDLYEHVVIKPIRLAELLELIKSKL